jgi:hypothetical protein
VPVEIHELDIVPQPAPNGGSATPRPEEAKSGAAHPDAERQIVRTMRWLSSRDHRLVAD